jgi:2-hydroxymuconate-semialdehyde hydrolase
MGTSHFSWRHNTQYFEQSFRVIAPDMPGYGFSMANSDFGFHIDDYVSWLVDLLGTMEIDRTHILAHSFGGAIAERLIRLHPQLVEQVVLVGPADLEQPTLVHNPRQAKNPLLNSYYNKSVIDLPLIQLSKIFNKEARTLETTYRVNQVNKNGIRRNGKPPVTHPVLMVWGREDRIIPLLRSERLLPHWQNVQFEVIDNAGHACHEEKPDDFNLLVKHFLSEMS